MRLIYIFLVACLLSFNFACEKEDKCPQSDAMPMLWSWKISTLNKPTNQIGDIIDVSFYNDQIGYMTTTGGQIFKTANRGATWTSSGGPLPVGTKPKYFHFFDQFKGYVSLDSQLLSLDYANAPFAKLMYTNNGGISWNIFSTNVKGFIKYLHFFDNQEGVAIFQTDLNTQKVGYTNNGGLTWQLNALINAGNGIPRVSFYAGKVYVLDINNKLWVTENKGLNWFITIGLPQNKYIRQIQPTDFNGYYYTTEEGLFYLNLDYPTPLKTLNENKCHILFFFDDGTGLVIQKPKACNIADADFYFDNGKKSLWEMWTPTPSSFPIINETELSTKLNDWNTFVVDSYNVFCYYGQEIYYLKATI